MVLQSMQKALGVILIGTELSMERRTLAQEEDHKACGSRKHTTHEPGPRLADRVCVVLSSHITKIINILTS